MNKNQALAWFAIEGFAPVKHRGLRGFSDGKVFVYWRSSGIRMTPLEAMNTKPEPAFNLHRFRDKQVVRCANWLARENDRWK